MIISVDLTKQIVEEGSNSITRKLLAFTHMITLKNQSIWKTADLTITITKFKKYYFETSTK
jgi:hypothetical protein